MWLQFYFGLKLTVTRTKIIISYSEIQFGNRRQKWWHKKTDNWKHCWCEKKWFPVLSLVPLQIETLPFRIVNKMPFQRSCHAPNFVDFFVGTLEGSINIILKRNLLLQFVPCCARRLLDYTYAVWKLFYFLYINYVIKNGESFFSG